MAYLNGVLCILSSALSAVANAESRSTFQPYTRFTTLSYSEPVSLEAMLDDWHGDFRAGTTASTYNWAEIGADSGKWSIAWLGRYDYALSFSRDTAEIYYGSQNNVAPQLDRRYDLFIEAEHFSANGLRVSVAPPLPSNTHVRIGLSFLRASRVMSGTLHGSTRSSENATQLDADVNYTYSEDVLFDRHVTAPTGYGYALDLEWSATLSPKWYAALQLIDVLGTIYWNEAPNTTAHAQIDTQQSVDPLAGSVAPAVAGTEKYHRYRQTLDVRGSAKLQYRGFSTFLPYIQLIHMPTWQSVGLGTQWKHQLGLFSTMYLDEPQAVEFSWSGHQTQISVAVDSLSFHRAHYFSVFGSIHF